MSDTTLVLDICQGVKCLVMKILTLAPDDVRALTGPIVYCHHRSETVLYVGMSKHGIGRPFHRDFLDGDTLTVVMCSSRKEATALERLLILACNPIDNRQRFHTDPPSRRNAAAVTLHQLGRSYTEIAQMFKISRQRVHQIIKKQGAAGPPTPDRF